MISGMSGVTCNTFCYSCHDAEDSAENQCRLFSHVFQWVMLFFKKSKT